MHREKYRYNYNGKCDRFILIYTLDIRHEIELGIVQEFVTALAHPARQQASHQRQLSICSGLTELN
jgi:hypothetical protein